MSDVSQEDFTDVFDVMTNRQAKLTNRVAELERNFTTLQESVGEMAKRQHIIAAALVALANKLEPGSIEMDQPTARDEMPMTMEELADRENDNLFTIDAGFGSIETEKD